MLGQVIPHRVVDVNPGAVLEQIYSCSCRTVIRSIYVANLVYGLAGRKYNKSAFGKLYQDKEEADAYGVNQMKVKLASNLYLIIDQVKRELSEGYKPVAHTILNGMRVLLHRIVSLLGKDAIAGRTDCVYTALTREEAKLRLDESWKVAVITKISAVSDFRKVVYQKEEEDYFTQYWKSILVIR